MATLTELAADDPSIVFITGDLGYGVVEEFAKRFPNQFLNAGVAEQAMTGVAAGLSFAGANVFTYSIANFPIVRCLEQVRNDVAYHEANVTIVSVGGGVAYGALGYSHHAVEDLAITRALPGMTVVAPGDPVEAALATRALVAHRGPAYLRLGKAGEPVCHPSPPADFVLGRALVVREGTAATLISTGGMLKTALDTASLLDAEGISLRVLSMHTVKPLDADAVLAAAGLGPIVTLEEHSLIGGLGSAVAEVLADAGATAALLRLGLPADGAIYDVGSQDFLRTRHGLTPAVIADRLRSLLS